MNLAENIEKLRCAKLQEQKNFLLEKLNNLKQFNLHKLLNEEVPMSGAIYGQTPVQSNISQIGTEQKPNIRKRMKKGTQPKSEDTTEHGETEEILARPHHGLALTPQVSQAQHTLLKTYYDKPETPEVEIASEPTWQNLQQAVANYRGAQVNQLLRQQRMLG